MRREFLPLVSLALLLPAAEHTPGGRMRRLSHSQYDNTVRDLLGDQSRPARRFPPEDFVHGFKNQVEAQSVPPVLAEAYSAAAEKLAEAAFRRGDSHKLVPCRPASAADSACAGEFIRQFGRKAFRRPLTDTEVARFSALFAKEARRTSEFLRGAQIVVEAMLQAPAFLFRMETAPKPDWAPYATASRLSYFLWDTMPDDGLLAAASRGELDTPEAVEKTARRMLADPRARQAVDEFVAQWLRFDRFTGMVKDRRTHPEFTPELGQAMVEETRRLIAHVVWNDRNFMEIFRADYSFLNSDLAALYGFPTPAEEFGLVHFPPDSPRGGILGHGTFLAQNAKPAETSPTARGIFVREQFLCQQVPNPPPGTNASLPPHTENNAMTTRQRLQEHAINLSCAGCHQLMDPIGYGLEKFDAVGRFREKESITFFPNREEERRNKKPVNVALELDTRGAVLGLSNSQFASPRELGAILAGSAECQKCMVKQLFRYAFGRREAAADRPLLDKAFEDFRRSRFNFKELIIAVATASVAATPREGML